MSTEISVTVERAVIETNLERCRDNAAANLIEMGRWLNRAKERGVVPHGEWRAWVEQHTCMNERTAQRVMQAAREIAPGSPLETLGLTKIRALLTLPAGEREEAAAQMDAASSSSAEVERAVAQWRARAEKAEGEAGAQVEKRAKAEDEAKRARQMLKDARETRDSAIVRAREAELRMARAQRVADDLRASLQKSEAERLKLMDAQGAKGPTAREAELEAKLAQMEREMDEMAEQLDEAQTATARGAMAQEERHSPASMILSAIGALMAEAGRAPGMMAQAQGELDEETRGVLIAQARALGQWCMTVIAAAGGDERG